MRIAAWVFVVSFSLLGCAARSPTNARVATSIAVACVPLYLFEFQVSDAQGRISQTGMSKLDARGCAPAHAEAQPGTLTNVRFGVDPGAPARAKFEAVLAGEHIEVYAPVIPNLRIVLEDRYQKHGGHLLVSVTPFESEAAFKQTIAARFARVGVDLSKPLPGFDSFRPPSQPVDDAAHEPDPAASPSPWDAPARAPSSP